MLSEREYLDHNQLNAVNVIVKRKFYQRWVGIRTTKNITHSRGKNEDPFKSHVFESVSSNRSRPLALKGKKIKIKKGSAVS